MALIENPNDVQNMFSKAGKITSEKYIVFQRKDEIFNNRPRYAKGKTLSEVVEKEVVTAPQKTTAASSKEPEVRSDDKKKQPFTKQMSRERAEYQKMSHDQPPPCGYYHPKFSEIDRKPHKVFDYNNTLKVTSPRPVEGKHGSPESPDRPVVERFRQERKCFVELDRQIDRKDIFAGRPTPHEKRFETVKTTETWSRIPRTPKVMMNKQLAREDLLIYKKKHYAPDYQPNFEYGRKQLGSCGPSFEKLDVRKDIMVKVPAYNNEAYFEYDKYSRSTKSSLFRTPTAPNFNKMLDREQDGKSLLPSFMQKFTNSRMAITFVHQKMLEVNNFRDGRFQTVTTSFNPQKTKKKNNNDESSDESMEEVS